ncbi:hypothetical protein [Sphingopyxis sp.]|jgi:hypothetical protein|uniref:hypothetical protein n=1 Tax=Sphingopyxis sp. TaxID=1908224 RepID=UPI002DF03C74|nr:hypothetical protein [Sphingopyxis sp.]
MIWGYIYIAYLVTSTAVVLRIGGWESRLAIMTLFAGSALTFFAIWFSGQYFVAVTPLIILFEYGVLAIFFGHAIVSRRYWTLCLPALQLVTCAIHAAKFVAPEIVPRVYSAGQGFTAYPMIALVVWAAFWEKKARLQHVSTTRELENA